jgi:flagellar hook-associated protein 1 FlgK
VSINSLFEISQRSFRALNAKMNATGQNIANSGSEGYSRRRVTLEASNTVSPGLYTSPAQNNTPGDGASVASFERVRSKMLDQAAAEAQAGKEGAKEEARILSRLEGALATDTEGSLTSSLESFFSGFNDLANNPSDEGVRETVLAKADSLTSEFGRLDQELAKLTSDTESSLSGSVDEANGLIKEVASLNEKISEAQASGSPDLAAKDRRDTVVKKLSGLVPVEAQENGDNGYTLSVDGMTVVQGKETTLLETKNLSSASAPTVEFGGTGVAFDPGEEDAGKIGAQLRTLNQTLPEVQGQLDTIAKNLVEKVNAVHEKAADQNGNSGKPFFDPNEKSAGTIQLDGSIQGPDDIAAVQGFDLRTATGRDNAVSIDQGDFSGSTGAGNLDPRLNDGDVKAPTTADGNFGGGLEGGRFDITVADASGNKLKFTVEDQSGDTVTGSAQTKDVSSGSSEIVLEANAGGNDLRLKVGGAFSPSDVTGGDTKSFSVGVADSASGDTTPAQNIADLSGDLTPQSIELATDVGAQVQQAESREEAKAASAERQEALAAGVSDVSVDEEMSNLIEQQQQFAASARVLRTAQEVTSTLLSM